MSDARDAAFVLVDRRGHGRQVTFGGDKGYDAARFIADLHQRRITPNIAVNGRISKLGVRRRSGMDDATTSSAGYVASQRVRNRVEEVFGWIKAAAGPR